MTILRQLWQHLATGYDGLLYATVLFSGCLSLFYDTWEMRLRQLPREATLARVLGLLCLIVGTVLFLAVIIYHHYFP